MFEKWVKYYHHYSLNYLTSFLKLPYLFVKYATIIIYHRKGCWLKNQDTWFLLLALLWKSCVTLVSWRSYSGPLSRVPGNQGAGRVTSQNDVLGHLLSLGFGYWVAFCPLFFPFIRSVSNAHGRFPTLKNTLKQPESKKRFSPNPGSRILQPEYELDSI